MTSARTFEPTAKQRIAMINLKKTLLRVSTSGIFLRFANMSIKNPFVMTLQRTQKQTNKIITYTSGLNGASLLRTLKHLNCITRSAASIASNGTKLNAICGNVKRLNMVPCLHPTHWRQRPKLAIGCATCDTTLDASEQ